MNMHSPLLRSDVMLTRTEVAGLVALAARTVPPLWPLESAIAVNPLAGFEDRPFMEAIDEAASMFGARRSLPLSMWRRILEAGHIDHQLLRDAAIRHLGGTYAAMAHVAPGVMVVDLLMARLLDLPVQKLERRRDTLAPDAGFVAKWCGAFFDCGISASPMPNRELGLYRAVLALARHDPDYRNLTGSAGSTLLLTVPRDPYEAIAEALADLGDGVEPLSYLSSLVARLPGWAGHIRWRTEHADRDRTSDAPAGMADLLALWMLLSRAGAVFDATTLDHCDVSIVGLAAHFRLGTDDLDAPRAARVAEVADLHEGELGAIFMLASEWTYANDLVPKLQRAGSTDMAERRPAAQLVMCIDVRSEPYRRAVEAQGCYETFGYAGFFGIPMALHQVGLARRKRLLPVLLGPQHDVLEAAIDERSEEADRLEERAGRDKQASVLFDAGKQGAGSAFATAEATGPLAGLAMLIRTFAPRLAASAGRRTARQHSEAFEPKVDGEHDGRAAPFSLAEKVGYAAALFTLTGMKPSTARLVVLAGHGGSAVNNPYAAALDCGACGGHAGGSNARVIAAMLNDQEVRRELVALGIAIPTDTWFLAAQHDTTTDAMTIFDRISVPATHRSDLAALERALAEAGATNRARRSALLGRTPQDLLIGAVHWGEIRPEWGLAGNAAFIVGPRAWSRDIDLGGRAFLHSYDWRRDPNGEALTTILTAPMVVAQWINCQYLFSTLDNETYGSGDKVTQNIVGGIGVVQGNGGDLKVGLPRQSLFTDAGEPYHIPQRLLTVVLAPITTVEAVVEANDILARLFGRGWVHLVVVDPETGRVQRWREDHAGAPEGAGIHSMTF